MDTRAEQKSKTILAIASILPILMLVLFVLMLTGTVNNMQGGIEFLLGLEFIVLYKKNEQKLSIVFGIIIMLIGITRFIM